MSLGALLTASYIALILPAFAQDIPAPDAHPQSVQQAAEGLLDKARQFSDIRSPGAPPFHLKATFSFVGKNLDAVEGTYTELWVSKSQWRRETIVKDWHRIEVAGATRLWVLDNMNSFPEQAVQLPTVLRIFPSGRPSFVFESISDQEAGNLSAECAITKPNTGRARAAFCFDKKSGAILERIFPQMRPRNVVEDSCTYAAFSRFGAFWFPRDVACYEDRHKMTEVKIADLSSEPAPDPALFSPPPGAVELGNCDKNLEPPRPLRTTDPEWSGSRDQGSQVTLSIVVDVKGKPQNLRVLNSGGRRADESALAAVRGWRFKPATCDGEPMPTMINVQVDFRLYR